MRKVSDFMTKKERALLVIELLKKQYPDAVCSLVYTDPFQLLVATRLAAQCTDARVNMVTPALFDRFPTPEAAAAVSAEDVEPYIHSCGLYKTKAKDIVALSRMLCEEFDGQVPDTMEELLRLPGIGRKTANLVLGDIFGKPAVVTDTHCIRICGKLGFTDTKDPYKVEKTLSKILPPEESNDFCHRLVLFGRDICNARNPKCDVCPLSHLCPSAK
jgi:endonuclease-3